MKELKKLMSAKIFAVASIFVFTFTPFYSFAEGPNVTSTVEADANSANGNIKKDVGNIDVTDKDDYGYSYGIKASAIDGKSATVNANDISVFAEYAGMLYGVEATAGVLGANPSTGRVSITTKNISSKGNGIRAFSLTQGSEMSITTNGDIQAGVGGISGLFGYGIVATANTDAKNSIIVNGNVSGLDVGISVTSNNETSKGKVNVNVYGDVIANNETSGRGLAFNYTSETADVLVTGTIAGKYGVSTRTFSEFYHPEFGVNNLTVWGISAPDDNFVMKESSSNVFEVDDEFAKKIKYIIKHQEAIIPKKVNGAALDTSHGYPVAKEGDKIIVDTFIRDKNFKLYNNGKEVTDKDEKGKYYVIVPRGGKVDLTAEAKNPMTLKGKIIKVKALALSKKAQTRKIAKAIKIINAKGTLSYQKVKGKKKITIDPTTGKITIKKGLKKGIYKVTVKVTASGDETYKPLTSKVAFTINVI